MTKKIIRPIREKINEWLKTINDEILREDLKSTVVLSGGAISSLIEGKEPNDFDIYLKDVDIAMRLAEYYTKNLEFSKRNIEYGYEALINKEFDEKSNCHRVILALHNPDDGRYDDKIIGANGISKTDTEKYTLKFISTNAITLHDGIQLVLRFVGDINDIHKNFDFIHNTNFYDYASNKLIIHTDALLSLHTKELMYRGSLYPLCSMFRIRKFLERGFTISAGQMLKIAMQINDLNLKDKNVLKEQLIGVDSAYFAWFINSLDSGVDVDTNYLMKLIDEFYDSSVEYEK